MTEKKRITYAVYPSNDKFDRTKQSPKEYIFPDYDYIPFNTFAVDIFVITS